MKRLLAMLLMLAVLPLSSACGIAPEDVDLSQRLYTVTTRVSCRIYADWTGTDGVSQIGVLPKNVRVAV